MISSKISEDRSFATGTSLPNFDTVTHKLQATFGTIKSTANFSIYLLCLQITFVPFLEIWPAKISRERKMIKWATKIAIQRKATGEN